MKILMISYGWPPKGSVGMLRMVKFAKYLVKYGYGVSVLTKDEADAGIISWDLDEPALKSIRVIRVAPPERLSFLDRINALLQPQLEIGWQRAVEKKLDKILDEIEFDVIISSSPPESAHIIASMIKERTGKKWIADLRDLWSRDHYRNLDFIRRSISARSERDTLRTADSILTVSQNWASSLKKQYGDRVVFMSNGYDEEYFDHIERQEPLKFTVSYLGKLNASHQDVSGFLAAVGNIVKDGRIPKEKIAIDFYVSGYGRPDITGLAAERGLSDVVREFGPVSLNTAYRIMKNSSLLLLVGWKGLSAGGWRPQKLYEYMGSGTPALLVNGESNEELAEVVASTGSGSVANDETGIEERMLGYYKDFTAGKRDISKDKSRLSEYSVSGITRKLCDLIG